MVIVDTRGGDVCVPEPLLQRGAEMADATRVSLARRWSAECHVKPYGSRSRCPRDGRADKQDAFLLMIDQVNCQVRIVLNWYTPNGACPTPVPVQSDLRITSYGILILLASRRGLEPLLPP
jgi:hypothetical protein